MCFPRNPAITSIIHFPRVVAIDFFGDLVREIELFQECVMLVHLGKRGTGVMVTTGLRRKNAQLIAAGAGPLARRGGCLREVRRGIRRASVCRRHFCPGFSWHRWRFPFPDDRECHRHFGRER